MPLSEPEFAALIETGCLQCQGRSELQVEAIVLQKLEIYRGEQLGSPTWGYKGEELVRGTFAIDCLRCKTSLYSAQECSLCGASDGVERALATETATPMGETCPECAGDKLTVSAYVAAKVVYGNGRAQKARSNTAPEDEGFHVARVTCKTCHHAELHRGACVLCGS